MDKRDANSDCEIRKIHGENEIYSKSIKCGCDQVEGNGVCSDIHIITQIKMKEMVKISGAVQKHIAYSSKILAEGANGPFRRKAGKMD